MFWLRLGVLYRVLLSGLIIGFRAWGSTFVAEHLGTTQDAWLSHGSRAVVASAATT